MKRLVKTGGLAIALIALAIVEGTTQVPPRPRPPITDEPRQDQSDPNRRIPLEPGGGPSNGGPGGFGPGGGVRTETKLVQQFDKNGNKRLDTNERKAAREFVVKERAEGRGQRRGGPRMRPENSEPPEPGPKLSPADVKTYTDTPLYDAKTLRTLFFEFESPDWEKELADFNNTDVEVPANLTVDGKTYKDVGVHFRGASSFFTVGEGRKRSFNVSLDFVHKDQKVGGYRTLNLLNSHTDPTFLRTILYYQVAREYGPAPKANYVRVVINGESWGVFVNAQQFNTDFTKEAFGSTKGARWKVPGSPRGDGGLTYLGEEVAEYKKRYEIKSKDDPKSWRNLIELCRVLNQTPSNKLEAALAPLLDIDGTLKFLAIENALINSDGYWVRASDYNLYQDEPGKFHVIPHDANETFRTPGGPGMRDTASVNGVELDPFAGASDPKKPLLSKLLAVPALKARYLQHLRTIAGGWLDWKRIGPLAEQYQSLIAADVKADTRKLYPFDAFQKGVIEDIEEEVFRGPRRSISLKSFVDQRRAYLLEHPELKRIGVLVPATK